MIQNSFKYFISSLVFRVVFMLNIFYGKASSFQQKLSIFLIWFIKHLFYGLEALATFMMISANLSRVSLSFLIFSFNYAFVPYSLLCLFFFSSVNERFKRAQRWKIEDEEKSITQKIAMNEATRTIVLTEYLKNIHDNAIPFYELFKFEASESRR